MNIEQKLKDLGFELLEASTPGGAYTSVNTRGNIVYVAIQFPIKNGEYFYQGRLGDEITTEQGYRAMQFAALNVITQVETKIGFDKIEGLNHIDAYYQSNDNWDDAPKVVDGASELFVNVLGEKGTHSRAIFGVHNLPRNFCVGLTTSFTIQ